MAAVVTTTGCAVAGEGAHAHSLSTSQPCHPSEESRVVEIANGIRRRAGLRPLVNDAQLAQIAGRRSAAMATERQLSHRGWERALRGQGVRADALGENVAYNYPSADAVMDGWMESAGHRDNILRRSFTRVGVGCVIDERGHKWWTQDFAS